MRRYTEEALDDGQRGYARGERKRSIRCTAHLGTGGRPRLSRDVYCYFDNDIKGKAPFDAQRLMQKLGLRATPPTPRHGEEPRIVLPLRPHRQPRRRAHHGM